MEAFSFTFFKGKLNHIFQDFYKLSEMLEKGEISYENYFEKRDELMENEYVKHTKLYIEKSSNQGAALDVIIDADGNIRIRDEDACNGTPKITPKSMMRIWDFLKKNYRLDEIADLLEAEEQNDTSKEECIASLKNDARGMMNYWGYSPEHTELMLIRAGVHEQTINEVMNELLREKQKRLQKSEITSIMWGTFLMCCGLPFFFFAHNMMPKWCGWLLFTLGTSKILNAIQNLTSQRKLKYKPKFIPTGERKSQ